MTLKTKLTNIEKSINELRVKADLREKIIERTKNVKSIKSLTNMGIKYEDISDLRTIHGEVSSLERDYKKIMANIERFKNIDPVLRKLYLFSCFFIADAYKELENKARKEAESKDFDKNIDRAVNFYHMGNKAFDELDKLIQSFNNRSMTEETYSGLLNDTYKPKLFEPVYANIKKWFRKNPKEARLFGGPRVYNS